MTISGYTQACNVKGKLLPYEASIRSMLHLCNEVWVAYDPRYDTPDTFTQIDDRVSVVEQIFEIGELGCYGKQNTASRSKCSGEWVLCLSLDELIHQKDVEKIKYLIEYAEFEYAESNNYTAIDLSQFNYVNRNNTFGKQNKGEWNIRTRLTKNIEGVTHGYPDDFLMVNHEGRQILIAGDGDDFIKDGKLYPFHVLVYKDFVLLEKINNGSATNQDILMSIETFPYIYHYARYSVGRKTKMKTHIRNNYFWHSSPGWDKNIIYSPKEWEQQLGEQIELTPDTEIYLEGLIYNIEVEHPPEISAWKQMIDRKIGWA